jgi:Pregnancy-associated plasma protein-A/Secretion system C-terminal sorting domain
MRTFALFLSLSLVLHAAAQRACVTQAYTQQVRTNKMIAARMDAADNFARQASRNFITGINGNTSSTNDTRIIRIPVVVHVLYNTAAQNVSDALIASGIAALNRDFRKQNSDTVNTPARFKALAADVGIEFVLATADPNGRPTTGIVRKQTAVPYFDMNDKIKFSAQGGDDAWDSKSYLNIWLGDLRRLLGYGTMPGGDAALDGLVINMTAFGTIGAGAPYDLGRTAVHETGHWLGLHHIWGDSSCGDDLVDDTPTQGGYTSGCPTGFRSSCKNAPDGDMYMNYMDFTNDACMNLFTLGQKQRMRAQFEVGGSRYTFLTSTGLNEPWMEAAPLLEKDSTVQAAFMQVYPNPAINDIVLQYHGTINASGNILYLVNTTGITVQKINITTATQKVTLTQLQPGIYFLEGMVNNTKVHQKIIKL